MALFRLGDEIFVIPVSGRISEQLGKVSRGMKVSLDGEGNVTGGEVLKAPSRHR
jgi:hypothetical protein